MAPPSAESLIDTRRVIQHSERALWFALDLATPIPTATPLGAAAEAELVRTFRNQ